MGGALVVSRHSNASISRVQFVQNQAYSGGCLYFHDFVRVSVLDSLFLNNTSESQGGAISLRGNSNLAMSNSTLVGEFILEVSSYVCLRASCRVTSMPCRK